MLRRKHCSAKTQALKTSVPYGFEKVEYLQAIEHSPMINTKYIVSSSTGIKAVFSYKTDSACHFYCGANQVLRPFVSNRIGWGWYGDFHNEQFLPPDMEVSNSYTIYESSTNYLDDLRATINGNSKDIVKRWKEEYAIPIYMFGCGTGIYNNFKGEIYNVKISENNSIVRDFIPSLDRTGTPCMFDLVTRKRFYNSGTGQFIYPTTSATYSLRRPQAEWAKITDTGVHKIYHTPIGYKGSLEEYANENNYKRLIETESPNEEGKYYSFKWVETDDSLTTEWFEVDPPQEDFLQ